jgi:hypothetical protein
LVLEGLDFKTELRFAKLAVDPLVISQPKIIVVSSAD